MALNKIIVISSIFFKFLFDSINIIPLESLLGLSGACVAILLPIAIFLLDGNVKDDSLDKFVLVKYVLQLKKLGISLVFIFVPLLFWTSKFGSIFKWIALMFLVVGYYLFVSILVSIYKWINSGNIVLPSYLTELNLLDFRNGIRLKYLKHLTDLPESYNKLLIFWGLLFTQRDWIDLLKFKNDIVMDSFFKTIRICCLYSDEITESDILIYYFKMSISHENNKVYYFDLTTIGFRGLLNNSFDLYNYGFDVWDENEDRAKNIITTSTNLIEILMNYAFNIDDDNEFTSMNHYMICEFVKLYQNNNEHRDFINLSSQLLNKYLMNVSNISYKKRLFELEKISVFLISTKTINNDKFNVLDSVMDELNKSKKLFRPLFGSNFDKLEWNVSNDNDNLLQLFNDFNKKLDFYLVSTSVNCFNFIFYFMLHLSSITLNVDNYENIIDQILKYSIVFDKLSDSNDNSSDIDTFNQNYEAVSLYAIMYNCNYSNIDVDLWLNLVESVLSDNNDNNEESDNIKRSKVYRCLTNIKFMLNSIKHYQDDNNKTA